MNVQMWDALAHAVVDRDERTIRAERRLDGLSESLGRGEHGRNEPSRRVRERLPVNTRNEEDVGPRRQGAYRGNPTHASSSNTRWAGRAPVTISQKVQVIYRVSTTRTRMGDGRA